jgi:hypothetical protein
LLFGGHLAAGNIFLSFALHCSNSVFAISTRLGLNRSLLIVSNGAVRADANDDDDAPIDDVTAPGVG